MQVVKVEPYNEDHDVFACHMILNLGEDRVRIPNIIRRSHDYTTGQTHITILVAAKDELDAYTKAPSLINKGADHALRDRS